MTIKMTMWAALLTLSCASTTGATRGGGLGRMRGLPAVCEEMSASEPELRIMVQAVRRGGVGARTLRNGDVLRSGDRFHLKVCTNHAARLYLLQATATGVALLRPTERHGEMIEPRATVRVPEAGYDITLDHEVGEEHLYVVASDRPIEESDPRIAAALVRFRARPAPSSAPTQRPQGDDRPDLSALAAFSPRGVMRSLSIEPSADDGPEVTEVTDRLVVWRLDLRHEP